VSQPVHAFGLALRSIEDFILGLPAKDAAAFAHKAKVLDPKERGVKQVHD
jgi:hypothetical protein